jgi:peptide/nickel transport system permease protein
MSKVAPSRPFPSLSAQPDCERIHTFSTEPTMTLAEQTPISRRDWLLSERPSSRWQARLGHAYATWQRFLTNRLAVVGLLIIVLLLFVSVFADQLAMHSPVAGNLKGARLLPPSAQHWFGTDDLGRDIFSRIVHGSRLTLFVVALVAIIAAPIGLLVGTASGYAGGWVDAVLMRITDIFLAFPQLILALAFVAALGPGIENAVLAIALTSWPAYARIARAETLTVRNTDYIRAVQLMGASPSRIVLRHIVPVCSSSLIVRVTLDMAGIILTAAGLGFVGLGAQPPLPEWGAMIASGRRFILEQWWVAAAPGLAIVIVSLGFNLLGDGLRDALDPRSSDQ